MRKSVAIVGGGPAGLVAAKTLLQHGGGAKFEVTVFEAAERVGGMWRSLPNEPGVKCSPNMRTNLSRFTVAFSDLSWTSIDLSDAMTGSKPSSTPSMFPEAWKVGRYLDTYARRFLPDVIRLNRRVTAAELIEKTSTWNVTSIETSTQHKSTEAFDYLIVASGFFDRPAPSFNRAPRLGPEASARIQHSSQFRNVASLTGSPGKIAVIGGGISGSEAAATAAFQISSAKNSPGEKPTWAECIVYHVINRPFYCLPRYVPQDPCSPGNQEYNLAPHFLPVDLNLYNLSRRSEGLITASNGLMPPEKAGKAHEFIRSLIGGDQGDTGREELVYKPDATQYPAYTGISDTYSEFVRSGLIVPVRGRVENIVHHTNQESFVDRFSIETVSTGPFADDKGARDVVDGIAGIVEATGFQVHLDYLADEVKQALGYDPECHRIPFLLSPGSIFSPSVPNIAFIGFYEGPYWGVMEMQAHSVAHAWDTALDRVSISSIHETSQYREVREAVKRRASNVPQFWMADYVGLIDEFARFAGIQRDDTAFWGHQKGPAFPARYCTYKANVEATSVIREVADILQDSESKARFVAAATFRAMQGAWSLQRKVDARQASMSGGSFNGTAHFHPRSPTANHYAAEYLYIEEGTFTMKSGVAFPATRRYIYRYNESTDTITAWFAEDDGLTAGALFNTWEFDAPENQETGWIAKGHHWCSPDTYRNSCEFRFRGAGLEMFGITYLVEGPKKDYKHESWYTRP